jgi:hypothetical protein
MHDIVFGNELVRDWYGIDTKLVRSFYEIARMGRTKLVDNGKRSFFHEQVPSCLFFVYMFVFYINHKLCAAL